MNNTLNLIRQRLLSADSLIISAGAGMGVDSGLPDFRGNQGMWQAYPELGKRKMDFTRIANPQAFAQQPYLAWGFYGHRLALYRETQPHQGFYDLLQLIQTLALPYFVFTSNVDGQFQKAGFDEQSIYECHGSIHHIQCTRPCHHSIYTAETIQPNIDREQCQWLGDLPTCPKCHALARPNILMFYDDHWLEQRTLAQGERLTAWLKQYHRPVVIELGAGTAVPTVRYFSEQFSPNLIRINVRESHVPKGAIGLAMTAKEGVATILNTLVE